MKDIINTNRRNIISIRDKLVIFQSNIDSSDYSKYKDIIADTGEEIAILLDKLLFGENRLFKNKNSFGEVISFVSINAHNLVNNTQSEHFKIGNTSIYKKDHNLKSNYFQDFFNRKLSIENHFLYLCPTKLSNVSLFQSKILTKQNVENYVKTSFILPMGMIYNISNLKPPYKVEATLSNYLLQELYPSITRESLIKFIRNKLGSHNDEFKKFDRSAKIIFQEFEDTPEIIYASIIEIAKDLTYSIFGTDPFRK